MTAVVQAPALRVLLVEDEPMIAMMVEDCITDMGFHVVGPAAQLADAVALASAGAFDCAILDINIRGGTSFAVADMLIARDCPFVLATGYGDCAIPPHLRAYRRLTKPYATRALETELSQFRDRVSL